MFSDQAKSQCPGSLTCEGAVVLCQISQLNGFTCRNPDIPNSGFPLGSLCFGAGAPHNLNWWAFVGAGGPLTLTFNLDVALCRDMQGIQAGVFEGNCLGTSIFACNAACNTNTFSLTGDTRACEIYYVWVDGCNSDVCQYTMTVAGNSSRPGLTKPMPRPTVNPNPPCLCGTAEVCFPGYSSGCEPTTTWTVDGVPTGVQGDDCIEVEFETMSRKIICVTATIGNPNDPTSICDQDMICIDVAPNPPPTEVGPLRRLCARNTPYIWHDMPITMSCINPPCSARVQRADGCCVDSLVPFQILPPEVRIGLPKIICFEDQPYSWHGTIIGTSCINPPCTTRIEGPDDCLIDSIRSFTLLRQRIPGRVDSFLCSLPPQSPAYRAENGRVYNSDQCMEEVTFSDPIFGCDTSYFLNLRYFKYEKDWEVDCQGCAGAVTLCPNIFYDPDCPEFNDGAVVIQLEWLDPMGNSIGITPGDGCIDVMNPGTYRVEITVSYQGKECPTGIIETIDVSPDLFPTPPTIDGDSSVCGSVPGTYFFDPAPTDFCEFNWTIKQGGGRIITPNSLDSSRIEVDWSNSTGMVGEVCLSYKTDCGTSTDTCFLVDFAGTPQISAGPDTNICGQAYTMLGIPDVGGGEWRQVSGPGMSTITDIGDPNTDVSAPGFGIYKYIWTESRDGCESIDTVTIGFRSTPEASNIDTICGGEATDFVIRFDIANGSSPYTIVNGGGSITGSTYTSDTILDNTPTTITIRDTFGCEFTFAIDHDCTCGNAVGTVSSDTLKNCGMAGQACIDYNDAGQMLVPGEDTVMFVLYSTQGDVTGSEIQRSLDGCFNFNAATMNFDQVYYIAAVVGRKDGNQEVDYNGGCLQIQEGQPAIWYTIPTPDAGADFNVCGQIANLSGIQSFAGSQYRWLNSPGVIIADRNNLDSEVTLQGTFGTYELILEETNAICPAMDTVEVTFFEEPESQNARELCVDSINRQNFDYVVCFDIIKGTPPYTLIQGGGSIDPTNNTYCSDQLMSLQAYDIVIEDANGCQFRLTGDHNCDCGASDPGTMDPTTLTSCVDQCVTIQSNGTELLQADEVAEFILHEGSGSIIVNELSRVPYDHTANPAEDVQFCFDQAQGMIPGRVYYISRLIRENGTLDDPCERLAAGTPVIWNEYPTSDAGADQNVCGLEVNVNALPSIGNGSWTVATQPAGSNVIIGANIPTQMVTVDQHGVYTFQWKEDNFGCADSASVTITFHDAPRVSNLLFECDDVAENYRIYIEIADGDMSSYTVNGVVANSVSANTFLTDWIPSGDPVSFCATDDWDCMPFCIDTSHVCECITEIGTMATDETACIDECIQASYNGGTTDPNDIIRYVLHDGTAQVIGTIIACNSNGEFCFDANTMTANQTYFIAVVAGNDDNSGCVDLNERCAVMTDGQEVTWYEYPQPDITASGMTFTCVTDSLLLEGQLLNNLPGNSSFEWSSLSGSICSSSNLNGSQVYVCASGTYVLRIVHDISGCATEDTIIIARDADLPNVTAQNPAVITCDQPTITLDATGSDFGGDFVLEWIDQGGQVIGTGLTVMVSNPGEYIVRVVNSLTDCTEEVKVTVDENTTPPSAVIDQIGQLSCTVKELDLEGVNSMTQGSVRSYSWSTSNGLINGSSTASTINIGSPGDYQLIIIDDSNGCSDTTDINVIEIGNTLEEVNVDATDPSCYGFTDGRLDINVVGGVGQLEYSVNGAPFVANNIFNNLEPGTYDIVVRDANGCEKDTMITITEPGEITVTAKEDMIKEAGASISVDTLIESVGGINRQDADREIWINATTGDTLNRLVIDSLSQTITFRVVLIKNGCSTSDNITIFVKYTRDVFVPNVIFPKGDLGDPTNQFLTIHGNNDRIRGLNFMRVYDRWGEMVYSKDNIPYDEDLGRTTEGWDGTLNGELMNPAVFIYHIEVSFFSSDGGEYTQQYFGDVTLVR